MLLVEPASSSFHPDVHFPAGAADRRQIMRRRRPDLVAGLDPFRCRWAMRRAVWAPLGRHSMNRLDGRLAQANGLTKVASTRRIYVVKYFCSLLHRHAMPPLTRQDGASK